MKYFHTKRFFIDLKQQEATKSIKHFKLNNKHNLVLKDVFSNLRNSALHKAG